MPDVLQLSIMPWDTEIDFSRVLDALWSHGYVVKYATTEKDIFGHIPTWKTHQAINNRESASILPEPTESNTLTHNPMPACKGQGEREKGSKGRGEIFLEFSKTKIRVSMS